MPRITVSISEEQDAMLDGLSGGGNPYTSKSAAVRAFLDGDEGNDASDESSDAPDERDELVDELRERIDALETENERLHRERRQLLEQRDEHTELVRYAETERLVQERREARRGAPVWRRAWRWVFGHPDHGDALKGEA